MSVEKRQKEQEKTSMVVEGFLFANEAEFVGSVRCV